MTSFCARAVYIFTLLRMLDICNTAARAQRCIIVAARDGRMFRRAVSLSLFCLLFSSLEGIGGSESYQQR